MSNGSFIFNIGDFRCISVSDGVHAYEHPAALLFPGAPQEGLEQALRGHNLQADTWTEWRSSYSCLVVDTGNHLVLLDTGAGEVLGPDTGKLLMNLESAGIFPGDIDTVVITHGHPDHLGGNTLNDRPAFPRARFVMFTEEWKFWTSWQAGVELSKLGLDESLKEALLAAALKNLLLVENQVELVEPGTEIVPGILALPAPGHTPGHMVALISSGGEQLYYISDAFIHPIHLEQPEWHMAVDISPADNVFTREQLLGKAGGEKILVHAFHFPFPGLGRIVKIEGGYQWQPFAERSPL